MQKHTHIRTQINKGILHFIDWLKPISIIPEVISFKQRNSNYFNNPFNAFDHYTGRPNQTVIDIDCVKWDHQLKSLRFMEVKGMGEGVGDGQDQLLSFFHQELKADGYIIECYIIWGIPPYQHSVIFSYQTREKRIATQQQLIDFNDSKIPFSSLKLDPKYSPKKIIK